jgi:cytoskeletal protein CcmA (bactofilin family)
MPNIGPAAARPANPTARSVAYLGATIKVKGTVSAEEDLHIEGNVEGTITLDGHRLTVGTSGQLQSEITAREVIIHGKIVGNVLAHERVEIKKVGCVVGDIVTARISVEEGAHFKGHIEIHRPSPRASSEPRDVPVPVPVPVSVPVPVEVH